MYHPTIIITFHQEAKLMLQVLLLVTKLVTKLCRPLLLKLILLVTTWTTQPMLHKTVFGDIKVGLAEFQDHWDKGKCWWWTNFSIYFKHSAKENLHVLCWLLQLTCTVCWHLITQNFKWLSISDLLSNKLFARVDTASLSDMALVFGWKSLFASCCDGSLTIGVLA